MTPSEGIPNHLTSPLFTSPHRRPSLLHYTTSPHRRHAPQPPSYQISTVRPPSPPLRPTTIMDDLLAPADREDLTRNNIPHGCSPATTLLRCCCGSPDCAYLKHNTCALDDLEKEVRRAGRLGQVCLILFISIRCFSLTLPGGTCDTVALCHKRYLSFLGVFLFFLISSLLEL